MELGASLVSRSVRRVCVAAIVALVAGCSAVYPEVKTPIRDVRPGQPLAPAPPSDLKWIAFKGAKIPPVTRDGRRWGNEWTNGLPAAYVKLWVNGTVLLESTVQRGTLEPSWPNAPSGNFRIRRDDRFRVELWDSRVMNDHPIGIREIGRLESEDMMGDVLDVETDSGVRIRIAFEPAHGRIGYGLSYELRTFDVYITRVFEESPASRAGIRAGDQVLRIDDRSARDLSKEELRSAFNAQRPKGLLLAIKHADGAIVELTLKEGAIYPLFREVRKPK